MKNFVLCSDLHGELPSLPAGEFLLLAGDLGPNLTSCKKEIEWFNGVFFPWLELQPHTFKIIIAGNHDLAFEREPELLSFPPGIIYLCDSSAEVGGVKFHGSPRTPQYGSWAFMNSDSTLSHYWDIIPADTQVLITHGPPFGIRDKVMRRRFNFDTQKLVAEPDNAGSLSLRERLSDLKDLRLHVFGHIHEGYGKSFDSKIWYVNAAHWDDHMRNTNAPIVLNMEI